MPILIFEAITNTKSNFSRCENGQPNLYNTEVYILAERILELIGSDLEIARKQAKI